MELESEEDPNKIPIEKGSNFELGRRSIGSLSGDRTVSRRHLSVFFQEPAQISENQNLTDVDAQIHLSFEVVGKNPIWVVRNLGVGEEKRAFKNKERGSLRAGDRFSISLKNPVFFTLKQRGSAARDREEGYDGGDEENRVLEAVKRRKKRTLERKEGEEIKVDDGAVVEGMDDLGLGSFDLWDVDPVREFGFMVMGQEYSQYPKQKIRHFNDWHWFLEEPREDSKDDATDEKEKQKGHNRSKRKNNGSVVDNDDDWTGESENKEVVVEKTQRAKRPEYLTRSRERKKPRNDTSIKKSAQGKRIKDEHGNEEDEEEMLGGFIVNDIDVEEDIGGDDNDTDEEEYDENDAGDGD